MNHTKRDTSLLCAIAIAVVIDTASLCKRFFPDDTTRRSFNRRMRLLDNEGLIQFIECSSIRADDRGGRLPRVVTLTQRGAEVVEYYTGYPPQIIHKTNLKPERIPHSVGMGITKLDFNAGVALLRLEEPQWKHEYQTYPGAVHVQPGIGLAERFCLYESFANAEGGRPYVCWPDASCLMKIPHGNTGVFTHLIGYFEFDRSTMVLSRIRAKMRPYELLIASETHKQHWPDSISPVVRIFFIAPSETRVINILDEIRDEPAAQFVRATSTALLSPESVFTGKIWRRVGGDAHEPLIEL